jgi:pimeloyl-ACP methyl ester carboxylesterase
MNPETPLPSLREDSPARAVVARISQHARGLQLHVVGHPCAPRSGRAAAIGRTLREQFQATTGIGLAPPRRVGAPPRRFRSVRRDGTQGLSFLEAGTPDGQHVLFVHGSPGSAVDWMPFLSASPEGQRRLAVDRPGFGESGPNGHVISLSEQAEQIASVLEAAAERVVVVGSSFGGPVALRLAADYPRLVSGVLLVGGAADPQHERIHPAQRLAAAPGIAAMLPRHLAQANAELMALREELEMLAGDLGRIPAPVTILHGLEDTLVPVENVTYLAERLTGTARLRAVLAGGSGHFLHILRGDLVEKALSDFLVSPPPRRPILYPDVVDDRWAASRADPSPPLSIGSVSAPIATASLCEFRPRQGVR